MKAGIFAALWAIIPLLLAPGRGLADRASPRFWAYQVRADGGIAAFSVAPNGDLAALPFVVASEDKKVKLLRHPNRPVLYALMPHKTTHWKYLLRVFGVGADGHLIARQQLIVPQFPALFSPDGSRLYVPIGGGTERIYTVASNGTLREAGMTDGGGMDNDADISAEGGATPGNTYGLVFAPSARFAFRVHHWSLLDSSGSDIQRFRVVKSGVLKIDGEVSGFPAGRRWDGDKGDLFFSRDGRTALMRGRSDTLYLLAVNKRGELRDGKAVVPGQKPGPAWAEGTVSGCDRTGRFVLITASSNGFNRAEPFRIGLVTGPGQLRKTTRFGKFMLSNDERSTFSAVLRPDNYVEAFATVGNAQPSRYHALFRLLPDGKIA